MGVLTMVKGPSGSGKTTSTMYFGVGEAEIFSVTGKRMPYRIPLPVHRNATYEDIFRALRANKSKVFIIDDSTYLMQFENFARAREKGYDKFTEMAVNFEQLLRAASKTSDDTTIYLLHHPQFADDGNTKPQSVGKMLDNQLCIEGLFDLVIECEVVDGKHRFFTNEHGLAKSPLNMLDPVMENNLYEVDRLIREFWSMTPLRKGGGQHAS